MKRFGVSLGIKQQNIICVRAQTIDLGQEKGAFSIKTSKKYCANFRFVVSLQRQKVNRLFRLVILDLGF